MTIVESTRPVTGGVDTHLDVHVAAALDANGGVLGVESFATTTAGCRDLHGWLVGFGALERVGVEGTGAYGAGLARFLQRRGVEVIEVDRSNRQGPGWWKASDGKFYPPTAQPAPIPPPPQPVPSSSNPTAAGFLRSLYDFKFTEFVTPRMIRFFYGFSVVILTLMAVLYLIAALASGDETAIILGLIGIPIIYLIYVIFTRIAFELIAIIFRMADDLRAIRRRGESL